MRVEPLQPDEVLASYGVVSGLYPHIPPLSLWRSFEHAAYRRFALTEPVLDLGCGDGQYFRLCWPRVRDVIGVDQDPGTVERARQSGVYREVRQEPADRLGVAPAAFASVFSNCALEHMDRLEVVLAGVARALRPGGTFLGSVVTDRIHEWGMLPALAERIARGTGASLRAAHDRYHHHVNALGAADWRAAFERAGLEVLVHVPILPPVSGRLLMFLDHLWHLPRAADGAEAGELGELVHPFLQSLPRFPQGFGLVLQGCLAMEPDWTQGCGAVFLARRPAR